MPALWSNNVPTQPSNYEACQIKEQITQEFIDNKGRYFITVPNKPSNFKEQALNIQKEISEQIDTVINKRFEFISYDGISKINIDKFFPEDQKVVTLNLTFNLSLFEGGQDYFNKKSATYSYYAKKYESDHTYLKVIQNLKDKYFDYIESAMFN